MASGLGAEMVVRTTGNPAVRLMCHPGSTRVQISFNGRSEIVNLCSQETGEVIVYPGRTPMFAKPEPKHSTQGGNGRPQNAVERGAKNEAVGAQ
jgi:hypothetical protein